VAGPRALRIDPRRPPGPGVLDAAVEVLAGGGVVAYPTDTLYGLAVDAAQPAAVERLFQVKGRDAGVAIPLIAADLAQAEAAGVLTARERRLAAAFWPGPLSLVVPAQAAIAAGVRAADGTVAIRVPGHEVARALASVLGRAITATSANRSGAPAALDAASAAAALGDRIDLIVDAGASPGGPPSTIVQAGPGTPRLVRAGAIAWDRVLEFLV
jgi:L-threonylcarbamoyladenylate synthase